MIVLTNGYKLPETGDFGDVWFPALEDNIQRVNDHNHDGTNSEKLDSKNISATNQTVLAGDFSASGNAFRATVNMPSGLSFDDCVVLAKDPTTKDQVYLKVEKITVSQFYLYTNFVQDFEVYFLT
jgi:hypothetical protein